MSKKRVLFVFLSFIVLLAIVLPFTVFAQEKEGEEAIVQYRQFFLGGGNAARIAVWIVAQLHLFFAGFVLGVPMFAVLIEYVGVKTKDKRYDKLSHELAKLLSASFATTAALGGLLAFLLIGLYPGFTNYMANIFHKSFYIYALLFFGETFSLYAYYYSWDWLMHKKWVHLLLGLSLNLFGTSILFVTDGWVTFMMSPAGINMETGALISVWDAVTNLLWNPLNIHRLIGNAAFGGAIVGAYAAVRFLGAATEEEKAHYDWMGYTGNFIGISALIPLPFAGYYLGREVYSASPVMGNVMMGGAFSWAFIVQAIAVGSLFIGANYYLWLGMDRITGAERYSKYVKYLLIIIVFSFAVWLTPHNLPLSGEERGIAGEQYHAFSKFFGVMTAKMALVNFIILATFFSFLLYRRANKGEVVPFSQQGKGVKIALVVGAGIAFILVLLYAYSLASSKEIEEKMRHYAWPFVICLGVHAGAIIGATFLTFLNRGVLAQLVLFGFTICTAVIFLGIYGFELMEKANMMLRFLTIVQVLLVLTCILTNVMIDIAVFSGARVLGGIAWGKMTQRSQFVLVFLCVGFVTLMGIMGFIRSGLRLDWHIYGFMRDTSEGAFTPSLSYMLRVVGICVILFLGLVSLVFWLAGLAEKKAVKKVELVEEAMAITT